MNPALAGIGGAVAGFGLFITLLALTGRIPPRAVRAVRELPFRRLGIALAAGVLTLIASRWPVGALLVAGAVWLAPDIFGPDRGHAVRLARVEAIAMWAEMLRDTLSGASALDQAIHATAPIAPEPIRAEIMHLSGRISSGARSGNALRLLAEELRDPTGDLIVAALVMASERQAKDLASLLSSLAKAARGQATMRMRVDAARAGTRTSVRVITAVTLLMAAGLALWQRDYLAPYGTPIGQLVLLGVGGFFGFALLTIKRMGRVQEPNRFFVFDPADGETR